MRKVIEVRNLYKLYRVGDEFVRALDGVDFEIYEGEFCAIVGTSGSGKSTLLNMLAGLEKPTKGRVFIAGQEISAMTESQLAKFRQENLGFIFQSYNLLPSMDAVENVALPLMFKGVDKKTREHRAMAALKAMGLAGREHHRPTEMSGGQQQRVGIARAFVMRPAVVFADEPTGNLDSATARQVLFKMLELAKKHDITFIMFTLEPELAGVADRVITILDGNVKSDVLQSSEQKEAARAKLMEELAQTQGQNENDEN